MFMIQAENTSKISLVSQKCCMDKSTPGCHCGMNGLLIGFKISMTLGVVII